MNLARAASVAVILLLLLSLTYACGDEDELAGSGYTGQPVYPGGERNTSADGDGEEGESEEETGEEPDPCTPNPCEEENRTVCFSDEDGEADCSCDPGFQDYGGGTCLPNDPCAENTSCAEESRECVGADGVAECGECLGGYHDADGACEEDEGCMPGTCSNHGVCDDTSGAPVCGCDPAFSGDHCEICDLPGDWPPSDLWYAGEVCNLPSCDAEGPICFDPSGTWTRTLRTTGGNCSAGMAAIDQRVNIGNVDVTQYQLGTQGQCDYKDGPGSVVMGVVHGNIEITCDINEQAAGSMSLETSVLTFDGDRAVGEAKVFIFPSMIYQDCVIEFDVTMERNAD